MIGRGTIVFKLGNGKNELYFVSPWELALAMPDIKDDEKKKKKFNKSVIKEAREKKWKPNDIVDDTELELIRKASNCNGGAGYHKYASDCIYIIDLSSEES